MTSLAQPWAANMELFKQVRAYAAWCFTCLLERHDNFVAVAGNAIGPIASVPPRSLRMKVGGYVALALQQLTCATSPLVSLNRREGCKSSNIGIVIPKWLQLGLEHNIAAMFAGVVDGYW